MSTAILVVVAVGGICILFLLADIADQLRAIRKQLKETNDNATND